MRPKQAISHRILVLLCLAFFWPALASAQWAKQPGETARNHFGPAMGVNPSMCRGACGLGCPGSCKERVRYECLESERLLRVDTFICSTHQGCRDHDDCLDACAQKGDPSLDCDAYCHTDAVERFGLTNTTSWAVGGGPFDGPPIIFEYTRDTPDGFDAAFRCPDGSTLQCTSGKGRCLAADGTTAEPIFDSFPGTGSGAMQISALRSGQLCGDRVCEQATQIRVTGGDSCEQGRCTRYGVEFDYENADPSIPLLCTGQVSDSGDFIGDMLKKGADSMPQMGDGTGEDGMSELLGMFQKVLQSADTPEDVQISMAPLDENGNPIESQRVGPAPRSGPASVPRSVEIPGSSGHLLVPMYQLADVGSRDPRLREVRCTHKGLPVLEVAFRLQF